MRDADYVNDLDTRWLESRGVVTPGVAAVLWFSRMQKLTTFSAAEAECMAVVEAVKEAFFVKQVPQFMQPEGVEFCISMFEDNQGGRNQVYNLTSNHCTKYVGVRHRFVGRHVQHKYINITHVGTDYDSSMPTS